MKSLKISIPEGFEIDTFNQSTGKIKFKAKPRDIKERIKTLDDVLNYHGIDKQDYLSSLHSLTPDEKEYRFLKLLASALNEDWVPDWSKSSEVKYFPWFKMGSPAGVGFSYLGYDFWHTISIVGSRLCFKSRELAEYAGKQFEENYKTFLTINQ